MKAKKIQFSALLLIGTVSLAGCFYYAPLTVKYNGMKYVKDWYHDSDKSRKDLNPCGVLPPDEEPLFTKNRYEFWQTNKFAFNFIYGEFEDTQFWLPTIYVAKNDLEMAKAYYHDKTNYDYYIGERFNDESFLLVEPNEEKEAIDYVIDVIAGEIKPSTLLVNEKIDKHNLAVNRKSKDGLFTTHKEQLVLYNKNIYLLKKNDGRNNTYTLYELGKYGKTLYTMFDKYNLI